MNTFGAQCVELRKRGHTLPEIVKITGRPKTTVHYYIQRIPLAEKKRRQWRALSTARITAIARQRKGKSARTFKPFSFWDKDMVLLVSHLLFDGEITHSACAYNNRNEVLTHRVESLMKKIYDHEPRRYQNPLTGVHRISYYNVALSAFIDQKAKELVRAVSQMPLTLKLEFVRAFFDDEGCMDYRPNENIRRIRGYQKDMRILFLVQKLLTDFTITSYVKKPNEIVLVGKKNLARFQKEINFSFGVCINGHRSNSIWKQPLEKRDLLKRAITSYKPVGSNGVHRQ